MNTFNKTIALLVAGLLEVFTASAQSYVVPHMFTGSTDGRMPGQLVGGSGAAFGTTALGNLFKINNDGTGYTNVCGYSIGNMLVSGNLIYGTFNTNGAGAICRMDTNGLSYTVLHSFTNASEGYTPFGFLLLTNGVLYGTSTYGGVGNYGTIYKINTDGTGYAILHCFSNTPDGCWPYSGLTLCNNALYGTTVNGGANSNGTIYKINLDGTGYTTLYSFANAPDGCYPNSGLVAGGNTLYGSTIQGGSANVGTIFKISADGSLYTNIYNCTTASGSNPRGNILLANGLIYGVTMYGGSGGGGVVFQVRTNGSNYVNLHSFAFPFRSPADGFQPQAAVVLNYNKLLGVTSMGGLLDKTFTMGKGTVFSLTLPAPAISPVTNRYFYPGMVFDIPFYVTNSMGLPDSLICSANVSDPNLICVCGGTGANRNLHVTGGLGLNGATVTLVVSDGNGASSATSFQMILSNQPPVISTIPNQQFVVGATVDIPFTVYDDHTASEQITCLTSVSDTNVSYSLTGTGTSRILHLSGGCTASPATVTLSFIDQDGASSSANVAVCILPAAIPPDRLPFGGRWNPGCIGTNGQTYKTAGTFVPPVHLTNIIDVTQPPFNAVGDGIHDDTTNIQNAIAAGDNSIIYLPPGTYKVTGQLELANQNWPWHWQSKILRGAGPTNTFIKGNNAWGVVIDASATGVGGSIPFAKTTFKGSTTLTLATNWDPYYSGRHWAIIYEPAAIAGNPWVHGQGNQAKSQLVRVLSINTNNNTVVFDPPAYFDWDTNTLFGFVCPSDAPVGIEDLSVENVGGSSNPNICFGGMFNCWIRNIESKNARGWHIAIEASAKCTICDSFIHGYYPAPGVGGGNSDYGVQLFGSSCDNLIINNCFDRTRHAMIVENGDTGNVFAYNYSQNPINQNQEATDYLMGDMIQHGATQWNLWEGNIAADFRMDTVLGGSMFNMCYRNNMTRSSVPATRYARWGYDIQTDNFYVSIIGSVMDAVGYSGASCRVGAPDGNQDYMFGQNTNWTGGTFPIPAPQDDPRPTLFVNGLVDLEMNTLTWADTNIPASLPASLFLDQKPNFWPANTPWPGIGPDVAGYKNVIPAMTRYASLTIQANPDNYTVIRNTATNLFPLLNDTTGVQGATVSLVGISALNNSSAGTVSLNSDGQSFSFTPNSSFLGTATLTYTMTDGYATAQSVITITVVPNPTNQPPVLSAISNQKLTAGFTQSIPFTVTDDLTSPNNLWLAATCSDPSATCTIIGTGSNRTLQIAGTTPNTGATVTLTAADEDSAVVTNEFSIFTSASQNSFPISNLTLTNNTLAFNIQGPSNSTWNVYTSTNLTAWTITDSLTFDNNGNGGYCITPTLNSYYKFGDGTNFSRTIGTIQITSVPGLNAFANQLDVASNGDPAQNTLDNIFRWTPLPANTTIGSFTTTNTTTWDGVAWSTSQTLSTGQACTLQNNTTSNITMLLIGYVQGGCLTNALSQAPTPVSSMLPLAGGITTSLGYQPTSGDSVSIWNTTSQNWNTVQYLNTQDATTQFGQLGEILPAGWYDATGNQQAEPQINLGQGFSIQAAQPNENWLQTYGN